MITGSILDWIDFGKVSAERDAALSRYFVDNGVLRSVIDTETYFLILGRKGAGKTAVFRYLEENATQFLEKDSILISLSFEDYNWNIHSLLVNENKSPSLIYKQSWQFVMLVECVRAYHAWFQKHNQQVPKNIEIARKILERVFNSPIPSISQIVGDKILSLSTLKLPKAGIDIANGNFERLHANAGEITFSQVVSNSSLKKIISENIENIISHLEKGLQEYKQYCPKIYICFDRVDEAWDKDSLESSRRVIAGLVTACNSINADYKGKIRPILFLREDIFDVLDINDLNKLREDCGSLLNWGYTSLQNMTLARVNHFGYQNNILPITNLDDVFDKSEMRQRLKPSKYLVRRTMMRPRDLISLLNRVVLAMKDKQSNLLDDDVVIFNKIQCDSIYDAEPGYSEWLKQEILDEWKVQKPVIKDLLDSIQNNGSTNLTKEALFRHLKAINKNYYNSDILSHLRFMFDNSIIGFKVGQAKEWRFKCFYPSQGFVESPEYRVHEGLVRSLNLTEAREPIKD